MKVNENGRNFLIFGRSFTFRYQNFDVLSTFVDVNTAVWTLSITLAVADCNFPNIWTTLLFNFHYQ